MNEERTIQNNDKETLWSKFKRKATEAKDAAVDMGKRAIQWAKDNPEAALVVLGVVATAGKTAIRDASRAHADKKEDDRRERYIYDRSLGMYWELRRPMTAAERRKFQELKAEGYRTGDILEVMHLIK